MMIDRGDRVDAAGVARARGWRRLGRRIANRGRRVLTKPYKRVRNRVTPSGPEFEKLWEHGIESELGFWRTYLATEGGDWPDEYTSRMDPSAPVQPHLVELLPDKELVRILDVGAGPLTDVGKVWPGHTVEVRAVDALADEYNALLQEEDVTPPVLTEQCRSEELADMFEPDTFDLVCAINTLDHSYDPMAAIGQMVTIGRTIYLEHHTNEAEVEGYWGLHQWNFDVVDDRCMLWRPGEKHDLAEELAPLVVSARKSVGERHHDNMTYVTISRGSA
jgi:hypothetical protein